MIKMLLMKIVVTFFFLSLTILVCRSWPGFQVLTERSEVTYCDKRYLDVWTKTGRANRTTIMTNASIHVYQTLPATAVVRIIGYEFKSNEYRRSAIDISKYMCDYFNGEYKLFFEKTLQKLDGNVPDSCPIKKGHYYWYNFVMESIYIPFKPIGERWMFDANLSIGEHLLFSTNWYIKIERNAEFWSH